MWSLCAQLQHASYNRLLNSLVSRSGESSYTGARVSYQRRKEIDYFHPTPTGGRIRVTRDADTLAVKPNGIIQKQRIADLNIFCPQRAFDYRISINVENTGKLPLPTPHTKVSPRSIDPLIVHTNTAPEPTSEHVSIREKNRLSYTHQNFIVDLTQVVLPEKPSEPIHELEIEFKNADELLHAAAHAKTAPSTSNGSATGNTFSQEWTPYDDQILIFLNNLRMLIRNASPPDDRK